MVRLCHSTRWKIIAQTNVFVSTVCLNMTTTSLIYVKKSEMSVLKVGQGGTGWDRAGYLRRFLKDQ